MNQLKIYIYNTYYLIITFIFPPVKYPFKRQHVHSRSVRNTDFLTFYATFTQKVIYIFYWENSTLEVQLSGSGSDTQPIKKISREYQHLHTSETCESSLYIRPK